jgi:hypothetical protein
MNELRLRLLRKVLVLAFLTGVAAWEIKASEKVYAAQCCYDCEPNRIWCCTMNCGASAGCSGGNQACAQICWNQYSFCTHHCENDWCSCPDC